MNKFSTWAANILSILLLSILSICAVSEFYDVRNILSAQNYIVIFLLIFCASIGIYFLFSNITHSILVRKIFSSIIIFVSIFLLIFSLFFFKNINNEYLAIYMQIKLFLPYLYSIAIIYSCNSVYDDDKKFELLLYLSIIYFVYAFIALDLSGAILIVVVNMLYSFMKTKNHFLKIFLFDALCLIIASVVFLSLSNMVKYFDNARNIIMDNNDSWEIVANSTFLPSSHKYAGSNFLIKLLDSFGQIGLIIATIIFISLAVINIAKNSAIEFWIFMLAIYILSLISILSGKLNFEFYMFSPYLPTLVLNSIALGTIKSVSRRSKI